VAQVSPEVPAVKVGLPIDFFESIREETLGGRTLPTWRGELYFELHRGVSQEDDRRVEING
jgi:alpha-mannosidase